MFAERYGWTPEQVDNLPLDVAPWIMPIAHAIDAERERRQEQERLAREAQQSVKQGGM